MKDFPNKYNRPRLGSLWNSGHKIRRRWHNDGHAKQRPSDVCKKNVLVNHLTKIYEHLNVFEKGVRFLTAHRATSLVLKPLFPFIFWELLPCETQKITLHEVIFNPCKVRLNIRKLKKWNFEKIYEVSNVFKKSSLTWSEIQPTWDQIDTRWYLMSHRSDYSLPDFCS